MIEYDYKLVRDEGNEQRTFCPDKIPKKLDNIVYIAGPNSCGKSTLLNILGLGFYGIKNETIPKSLRNKMSSLLDSDHNKLIFDFTITTKNNIGLFAEKNYAEKTEIKLYELNKGKKQAITKERFERNYNFIYDIPIDPTARLGQLIVDIKDYQVRYGNAVGELKERIRDVIKSIRESRDPKRIEELKSTRDRFDDAINVDEKTLDMLSADLETLEKYTYHKFYHQYKTRLRDTEKRITGLKRKKTRAKHNKIKLNEEYEKLIEGVKIAISEMQQTFDRVTSYLRNILPKEEENHFEIWNSINIDEALSEFEFDEKLDNEIIHFNSILNSLKENFDDEDKIKEVELYKYLIQILQSFVNLNISLPGGKSVTEFIDELTQIKKEKEPEIKLSENIHETLTSLATLRMQKSQIETMYFVRLKKFRDANPEISSEEYKIQASDDLVPKYEKIKENISERLEFYEKEWIKKGKPSDDDINKISSLWKQYDGYTEEQLKKEIKDMKDSVNTKKAEISKKKMRKDLIVADICNLEKKKEHPFQKYLDELEDKLLGAAESLEQKLRKNFYNYINELIDEKAGHSGDIKKEKYYHAIFSYLAKRIDFIRHLEEEYKVKYIDIIDELILTEEGKKIKFADLGTGQSQSAYLMGKLNTADDRKIIAFFDEVAMMDSTSIEPIYAKLQNLYKKGKLLAGIIVQRDDNIVIVSKLK
jgi:exonuclease SbcC